MKKEGKITFSEYTYGVECRRREKKYIHRNNNSQVRFCRFFAWHKCCAHPVPNNIPLAETISCLYALIIQNARMP